MTNATMTRAAKIGARIHEIRTRYRLTLEPWTALLRLRRNALIFQDQDLRGILERVFADYPQASWRFDVTQPLPRPRERRGDEGFLFHPCARARRRRGIRRRGRVPARAVAGWGERPFAFEFLRAERRGYRVARRDLRPRADDAAGDARASASDRTGAVAAGHFRRPADPAAVRARGGAARSAFKADPRA